MNSHIIKKMNSKYISFLMKHYGLDFELKLEINKVFWISSIQEEDQ
jgi:hypothetical protein